MVVIKTNLNGVSEKSFQNVARIRNMDLHFDDQIVKIFDNIFEFYGFLLPQGNVSSLSGKIFKKTFTDPQHLTGHSFADTVFWQTSEQNYQKVQAAIKTAQNGQFTKQVLEFRISVNDKKLVEISLCPIIDEDEKINQIFVCGQAVSEVELSRVYELEKKARDEAEEANRTKDYFLALVSHELRTPLNAILGWTKILLQKDVDEKTRRNALETIERSASAQAKLLSDLVDSARIASGRLRLELRPMNLFHALKTVYLSQKPQADIKKINVSLESDSEDIIIFGDLIRIQQVFGNLLSNALKFSKEGGNIWISIKTDDKKTIVTVKDDGRGINNEYLPNIFRQFSQGEESISRQDGGLGLGLSIVKILVEKHQGNVTAESQGKDLGAKFVVELPLYMPKTNANNPPTDELITPVKSLNNIHLLVVEDDEDSREVLKFFLEQNKAKVTTATSAEDALSIFNNSKNIHFDAIISDLGMPNGNGYYLISQIRTFPVEKGGAIPALALSAFTAKENIENAFSAGFQKYHTKPFVPDVLIKDIIDLVNKTGSKK